MPTKRKLKIKQLVIAPFTNVGSNVLTYSTLGLAEDGSVWRYDPQCSGWIPYNMEEATCTQHRR